MEQTSKTPEPAVGREAAGYAATLAEMIENLETSIPADRARGWMDQADSDERRLGALRAARLLMLREAR